MADVHRETYDVDFGGVLRFGAVLVVAGIVIAALVWVFFGYLTRREARQAPAAFPLAAQEQNRLPPEPRLQTDPRQDLVNFRAQEDAILTTYGWVNRNAGIVRIPIDEAMKLTVERGLPARPEGTGSK